MAVQELSLQADLAAAQKNSGRFESPTSTQSGPPHQPTKHPFKEHPPTKHQPAPIATTRHHHAYHPCTTTPLHTEQQGPYQIRF